MNTEAQPKPSLPVVKDDSQFSMLLDTNQFAQLQRVGHMYAQSKMVPAHFQGDDPSCMVAVQMAMRLGVDPFMFLQKTYVVGGKPGMEAPLAIALINTRGPFKGPIQWQMKYDKDNKPVGCTAFAFHRETGERCEVTITKETVEAEGWLGKAGSKWKTMPEQMYRYRTASWLGRLYCPEVLMGMEMADELADALDVTTGEPTPPAGKRPGRAPLKERMGAIDGTATQVAPEPEPVAPAHPNPAKAPEGRPLPDNPDIIIHDDAPPAGQEAAGGAQAAEPAPDATEVAHEPPAVPASALVAMAKKAKSREQADIVADAIRDPGYTAEDRQAVQDILNSKKFAE